MDLMAFLERLFTYDDWANRETLSSLGLPSNGQLGLDRIFAHIVAAEWLWLARLQGVSAPLPVWPEEMPAGNLATSIADLRREWSLYFATLTPAVLSSTITYTNSKGERYSNTVMDVLTHVAIHSAYHRGQIASGARAGGGTPAYTDFIHCVRAGLIE